MSDEVTVMVRLTFKEGENDQFLISEESLEQSILRGLSHNLLGGKKVFKRVRDEAKDRKYQVEYFLG